MTDWNGGYGDALDVQEVLAAQEKRIAFHARQAARPHADAEDLKQEARIAVWRVAVTHPGDPLHGLAPVVIKRAIAAAAEHQRWTGNVEERKGQVKDPLRRPHLSLDMPVGNEDEGAEVTTMADSLALVANDVLDAVLLAYHYGEVWAAISALSPEHKRYVYLKFWQGLSEREIAAATGRTAANVNRTWHDTIKPRLRAALAHLASV